MSTFTHTHSRRDSLELPRYTSDSDLSPSPNLLTTLSLSSPSPGAAPGFQFQFHQPPPHSPSSPMASFSSNSPLANSDSCSQGYSFMTNTPTQRKSWVSGRGVLKSLAILTAAGLLFWTLLPLSTSTSTSTSRSWDSACEIFLAAGVLACAGLVIAALVAAVVVVAAVVFGYRYSGGREIGSYRDREEEGLGRGAICLGDWEGRGVGMGMERVRRGRRGSGNGNGVGREGWMERIEEEEEGGGEEGEEEEGMDEKRGLLD